MKRTIITCAAALMTALAAQAQDTRVLRITQQAGHTLLIPYADITSAHFTADAMLVATPDTVLTLPVSSVAHFCGDKTAAPLTVSVHYDESAGVTYVNPLAHRGLTVTVQDGHVTIDNPIADTEVTVALSGSHTDGSLTYNGSYKTTLCLDGIELTSRSGAAIHINCGKRIAVILPQGTVSTLADARGGEHKAALYFKGHPEFEGAGTLNVSGYTKHAIASKEYMQLKKTVGSINILRAAQDGIHAGQYFQMNGGTLNIANVGDDGVQAEATSDDTDEMNGEMLIKGGTINITCTADGTVQSTASQSAPMYGPGGGGWPGGGGGWPPGGDTGGTSVETSSSSCLKCDKAMTILGGTLNLKSTGKGGKGIKADGALTIGAPDTEGPVITAATTGSVVSKSGTGMNAKLSGQPKAIRVEGNIEINSGHVTTTTQQEGGEGIESKATITINGGTVVCNTYDDGINAAKKITVNDGLVWCWATGNDGMDCNGSAGFEFNGGVVLSSGTRSPEEGFDCDNYKFVINGGTLIGTGGATSTPTTATQPYKTQSSQSLTADTYLSLQHNDGTVICSYRVPHTLSATVLVSSPQFQRGTSYRLVRNSTAVTNPTASYLDGRFTTGGTLTGGTSTTITPQTK